MSKESSKNSKANALSALYSCFLRAVALPTLTMTTLLELSAAYSARNAITRSVCFVILPTIFVVPLLILGGCASSRGAAPFRVEIPVLSAPPIQGNCRLNGEPVPCVAVLQSDWENVIRALKAACLANGQSKQECLAE